MVESVHDSLSGPSTSCTLSGMLYWRAAIRVELWIWPTGLPERFLAVIQYKQFLGMADWFSTHA